MNTKTMIELFGYIGSALVVVSMLMSSVVKLRIINLIGSVIFAIYALIIKSYPTALMNFFLVGINIYHLIRLMGSKRHYELLQLKPDDSYLSFFLNYYKEDIKKYFQDNSITRDGCNKAFAVCCDNEMAGVLMGRQTDAALVLMLDYSTPVYRDCSVGEFIYGRLPEYGIKSLVYTGDNPDHVAYIEKMGFEKQKNESYIKRL